jgi:hypothetical protein
MPSWIDIELLRSEGNPNHVGSGPKGGQFTSGSGGGGVGGKPHGKHFAERQRRKAKLKAKQKEVVKKHTGERKEKRQQHMASLKAAKNPKERAKLREKYRGDHEKTVTTHAAERKAVSTETRESTHSPTEKAKLDRLKKGKPEEYKSEKARRAAENQSITDKSTQDYTKANENTFANRIGGKSFPDNDPIDIHVPGGGVGGKDAGIELKTLTHGKNDKITMSSGALERKDAWESESKTQMHTVALDHRDRFGEGKNASLYSGHEIYYKRGVGSFRISSMYKVKDEAELKLLLKTPYDKLPKAAQGPVRGVKK